MADRMLLTYATKHGSTAEVAGIVAAELRERGIEVDVTRAADVEEVGPYDAVVLGVPLYMGRWHGDARSFLRRFAPGLRERPLAVFTLGPVKEDGSDRDDAHKQLAQNVAKSPVTPTVVELFGGAVDPELLHFPFSRLPASDARDWDAIRAWARRLPEALLPVAV